MQFLILAVLVVLAIALFALSGKQRKTIKNRREEILNRIRERRFNQRKPSGSGT